MMLHAKLPASLLDVLQPFLVPLSLLYLVFNVVTVMLRRRWLVSTR